MSQQTQQIEKARRTRGPGHMRLRITSACRRSLILCVALWIVAGRPPQSMSWAAIESSPLQAAANQQTADTSSDEAPKKIPSPWPEDFPDGPWWNDGLFCGPNALFVLLRLHDVPVTMEEVHSKIEIRPGLGCTPEQLRIAGAELGMDLEERFVPADQLLDLQRPFILHGAQSEDRDDAKGHFWVVVGFDEGSQMFAVVDASSGIYRMIRLAQVEKQYSGWVVVPKVESADTKLTIARTAFFGSLFLVGLAAGFLLLLDMRLKRRAVASPSKASSPTD